MFKDFSIDRSSELERTAFELAENFIFGFPSTINFPNPKCLILSQFSSDSTPTYCLYSIQLVSLEEYR